MAEAIGNALGWQRSHPIDRDFTAYVNFKNATKQLRYPGQNFSNAWRENTEIIAQKLLALRVLLWLAAIFAILIFAFVSQIMVDVGSASPSVSKTDCQIAGIDVDTRVATTADQFSVSTFGDWELLHLGFTFFLFAMLIHAGLAVWSVLPSAINNFAMGGKANWKNIRVWVLVLGFMAPFLMSLIAAFVTTWAASFFSTFDASIKCSGVFIYDSTAHAHLTRQVRALSGVLVFFMFVLLSLEVLVLVIVYKFKGGPSNLSKNVAIVHWYRNRGERPPIPPSRDEWVKAANELGLQVGNAEGMVEDRRIDPSADWIETIWMPKHQADLEAIAEKAKEEARILEETMKGILAKLEEANERAGGAGLSIESTRHVIVALSSALEPRSERTVSTQPMLTVAYMRNQMVPLKMV